MSEVHTDKGDIIKGDRIIGEARGISEIKIIVKSGRHISPASYFKR